MRKYRKNPAVKGGICVNGVNFDDDTVVTGDQWEQWTRPMFPGVPPSLVLAVPSEPVTSGFQPSAAASSSPPASGKTFYSNPASAASSRPPGIIPMPPEPEDADEPEEMLEPPNLDPTMPSGDEDEGYLVTEDTDEESPETEEGGASLTDIPGVGESRAVSLIEAGYTTIDEVAIADPSVLMADLKIVGARVTLSQARKIVRGAKNLAEG